MMKISKTAEQESTQRGNNPLRLAVFYASVGTGHKVAAESLCESCLADYPGSEVICRDLLDYAPRWVRWSVVNSYLTMARKSPGLWGGLYQQTDTPPGEGIASAFWDGIHRSISEAFIRNLFAELDDFKPDALLLTHFFGISTLMNNWDQRARVYFVNTDYISHVLQRDRRLDGWFVASDEAVRQYRADSVPCPDSSVRNFGIPISTKYKNPPTREEARAKLGISSDKVMVTVAGGGIGAGALGVVADSMLDYTDWSVVLICGNNRRMHEALRDKFYPFKHITVHGFVDNMPDYYAASDLVVLKPGGLSVSETLAMGSALLLLDPLPGQEQYNCDYLLERGAAKRIFENRRVGELIRELLDTPEVLERMKECARATGRPNAASDIIAVVASELDKFSPPA